MLEAGTWKLQLEMCVLGEHTDRLGGVRKTLGALGSTGDPGDPAALIDYSPFGGIE